MELSSCKDCHDLAETLRYHVKMVSEAREYATDAHAGVVRHITPLEALQEQAEYYEGMLDEVEGDLEVVTAEVDKLAQYILSISPQGVPEGSACEVAISLIEFLRNDDGETKEFKICVPRLL